MLGGAGELDGIRKHNQRIVISKGGVETCISLLGSLLYQNSGWFASDATCCGDGRFKGYFARAETEPTRGAVLLKGTQAKETEECCITGATFWKLVVVNVGTPLIRQH